MRRRLLLLAVVLVGLVAGPREGSAQQPQKARPPLGIEKLAWDDAGWPSVEVKNR